MYAQPPQAKKNLLTSMQGHKINVSHTILNPLTKISKLKWSSSKISKQSYFLTKEQEDTRSYISVRYTYFIDIINSVYLVDIFQTLSLIPNQKFFNPDLIFIILNHEEIFMSVTKNFCLGNSKSTNDHIKKYTKTKLKRYLW